MHTPVYLDTSSTVDSFLATIANAPVLALDTEGASFHRFVDRIYLLQLSTREQTAIIDPIPIGTPPRLGTLLEGRDVEVVFHDADYDLRLLQQDYGWHVRNIFDTKYSDPVSEQHLQEAVEQNGRTARIGLTWKFLQAR